MPRRLLALLVATAATTAGLVPALGAVPASALEPGLPFTSVGLSTWQTNARAWSIASSQGLVFVGGDFSSLRPPGAAAGTSEQPRSRFAVLDAATGAPTGCAPSFTMADQSQATVRALEVSPDGATLYIGGLFTSAGGVAVQHLAALDIATCTISPTFRPLPNGTVRAIDATSTAVYYGGSMVTVGGQTRRHAAAAAAVGTPTPGALLDWAPSFDLDVRTIALKPDASVVLLGGEFGTVNGAAAHALTAVDPQLGAVVHAFPAGLFPPTSATKTIAVDATGFYTGNEGTGFQVFDGRTAFNWDFTERWRDTCLGATQSLVVYQGLLYSGSHAHDCSTMGEYPDGPRQHLLAQSVDAPALLAWHPNTNDGTGEGLGPRGLTVAATGSGDVLWVAGEFTSVGGAAQQGLTRFSATARTAGPSTPTTSTTSRTAGEVRVAWRQSTDLDDQTLTYRVYRDGAATPAYTVTGAAPFWSRRQLSWTDTQPVGSTHTYKVTVTDGDGNVKAGPVRSVKVTGSTSAYATRVAADGAVLHWRYDEPGDVFVSDATGSDNNGTLLGGATFGVTPAALTGDPSKAFSLPGTSGTVYSEQRFAKPRAYTLETWFRTTTTTGGKIMGFGDKQVIPSRAYDKMIYMTNGGKLVFGANSGTTLTSPASYSDGAWHHVVATQGPAGMTLYADGVRLGSNTQASSQTGPGYLRVGGDALSNAIWPSRPTSAYWKGTLDETALYLSVLSDAQVSDHYAVARTGAQDTTAPSATDAVTAVGGASSVALSWAPATDDRGVVDYLVHRSTSPTFPVDATTQVAVVTSPQYTDAALPAGTYSYVVRARDAAGNTGPASPVVSATVTPPPTTATATLLPTADTYANQGAPSSNFGTTTTLFSRGSNGYVSYLRFALPAAPAGTTLTGAVLELHTTTDASSGSADEHTVRLTPDTWSETGLTWQNRPAPAGDPLGRVAAGTRSASTVSTGLSAAALAPLLGGNASLGITSVGTDVLSFYSRTAATASRPRLVLTFSPTGTAGR